MKKIYGSIVKWLIQQEAISSQEEELYVFAMESLMLLIAPLFLSIAIGTFYQKIVYRILIVLPFMLIRKYSGGYHAKNPIVCLIISSLLIIVAYEFVRHESLNDIVSVLYIIASAMLCVLSPVDSENRRLTYDEKKKYGQKCRFWVVSFGTICTVLKIRGAFSFSFYLKMGVIISAVLQLPCCFKKLETYFYRHLQ